jgi:hypothetical protein
MIDHAHRHIMALWELINDFVGTLLENGGANMEVLSIKRRVALAVAVWMHDVGHRGDEYVAGSMDIRASHAGISDRLLLRNPDAYRLGWLLEPDYLPHGKCCGATDGRSERLECRNRTRCTVAREPLCLLREIGLLCRHHQSNAPLDLASLQNMASRGKEPSVYSLVPDSHDESIGSEKFLRDMTNEALPVPSPRGVNVLTLRDFETTNPVGFRCVAGLLRMLDAMQLHRSRVGTSAFIASFQEFLDTKFEWCRSERRRLESARRAATPGRKAFQRTSAKIDELDEYEVLLKVQQVHFWRQSAVHKVKVRWTWLSAGKAALDVLYMLDPGALDFVWQLKTDPPQAGNSKKIFKLAEALEGDDAEKKWIKNFQEEVMGSEHESQYPRDQKLNPMDGYLGVFLSETRPRIGVVIRGSERELKFIYPTKHAQD